MLRFLLPAFLLLVGQASAQAESSDATEPARVLVYTVSAGFQHGVVKRRPAPDGSGEALSLVEQLMTAWADEDERFEVVVTRDAEAFDSENLAAFDVVFFYTTGELPLSEEQRKALFAFVRGGGGFAGSHCATDTFYKVPEYGHMIGGYFDGHPWHQEVRIRVEDGGHDSTSHLGDGFVITDEIYQFRAPYDRDNLHVLLSLDNESVDTKKGGVKRTDGDFAVSWIRNEEMGRVFYTSLGHRPAVWKDARFRKHLVAGLLWAAGAGERAPKPIADKD